MGMLNESDFYPAFDTNKPFTIVGEVWVPYQELRDVPTKYGDFTGLSLAILPRGAARTDENVVSVLVKKGGRLAELSKAVKASGASDIEEGGMIAIAWDGATRKMEKGDMRLWKFQYKAPTKASGGGMLDEAAADPANHSGQPEGEPVNLLGD